MKTATTTRTNRERLLLALFPAAIILAVYSVVFAVPLQRTNADLHAELSQQQRTAVKPADAQASLAVLTNAKNSLDRLKKRSSSARQQIRELSQSWRSGKSRLETVERITELMRDYNLSIVSQGNDEGLIVSNYLRNLLLDMNKHSPLDPIEFWHVEVKGAYFEVADFLAAVDLMSKRIIPVAISMKPESPGESGKSWTIVFVI